MSKRRVPFDLSRFKEVTNCFICEFLGGNPKYAHHVVAETDRAVAFLNRFPTLEGYVLVAPKDHREQVTGEFTITEYLELQRLIFCVSEGLREHFSPERIYVLSLGSQAANAHVHWHVAPLPPDVPLEEQQYYALMHEHGALDVNDEELASLAQSLRPVIQKMLESV